MMKLRNGACIWMSPRLPLPGEPGWKALVTGLLFLTACPEPNLPPDPSLTGAAPLAQPGGGQGGMPPAGLPPLGSAPGNPGAAPQGAAPTGPAVPDDPSSIVAREGQVLLKGTIRVPSPARPGQIQIDANAPISSGVNGPLATIRLASAGEFALTVPRDSGSVNFMIYVGVTTNDPGSAGPENVFSWGPVQVSDESITDLIIDLSSQGGGAQAMPVPGAAGVPATVPGNAPGQMPPAGLDSSAAPNAGGTQPPTAAPTYNLPPAGAAPASSGGPAPEGSALPAGSYAAPK